MPEAPNFYEHVSIFIKADVVEEISMIVVKACQMIPALADG